MSDKEKIDDKDFMDDTDAESYEDICYICRRPESKAGKMFKLPNNICVCDDCMHKTMDTVSPITSVSVRTVCRRRLIQ